MSMDQHPNKTVVAAGGEKSHGVGVPLRSGIIGLAVEAAGGFPPGAVHVLARKGSTALSTSSDETFTMVNSDHDSASFDGSVVNESETVPAGRGSGGGGDGGGGGDDGGGGGGTRSIPHKRDQAEFSEPEHPPNNGQRLRKACDLCTKRKRKCNGNQPCSQCIETGVQNQCIYSPRLKSGRKKKVRIDGVLYEEGAHGGELALVAGGGAGRHAVDPSAGRFSASGAVGLAGHLENVFLATYLRDFNRIVPLTSESSVTEGMLEVLSPAVSSRGLATANPIKQPKSRRQAKRAVFWGVVAMGSRILGASDESTLGYLALMRKALRECFDCNDKEVVQAYLLLSTVQTMRGNEAAGKRYLDHAHTMHNGNAMGPGGELLRGRTEQDESTDLVFQIYDQPDGCVGGHRGSAAVGDRRRDSLSSSSSSSSSLGAAGRAGEPISAVNQMIAQAMAPPSDANSSPVKALKYLSTACGLSSEVFDPTNKCVTVKQYIAEMDSALKGVHSIFASTDLGECITGVMMVKIWGGVTVLMRSWGKPEDRDIGLAQVEEGIGYALTRPGLFTFPLWWHGLHCASVILAHFGRGDTYMRLRETFNKHTFPGTEMPSIENYIPGSVCPQLDGSCSKLAHWLQARGTVCGRPEWKPQFANGQLSGASENAAYAVALERGGGDRCAATAAADTSDKQSDPRPVNGAALVNGSPLRAALDAGLSEIGAHFDDLSGLGILGSTNPDLDPLGVEFDLSQLPQEPEESVGQEPIGVTNGYAEASMEAFQTTGPTQGAAAVTNGGFVLGGGRGGGSGATSQLPANLVPEMGGGGASANAANGSGTAAAAGAAAVPAAAAAVPDCAVGPGLGGAVITGGGELSRFPSFGISGPAAVSSVPGAGGMWPGVSTSGGEFLSRNSSLDINTIMQMVSSDEELKMNEGVVADAMDNALAFGEGPAKELFGVELSNS